jgi:hypothetical protein
MMSGSPGYAPADTKKGDTVSGTALPSRFIAMFRFSNQRALQCQSKKTKWVILSALRWFAASPNRQ